MRWLWVLGVVVLASCSPVSPTVVQTNWCAKTVNGQAVLYAAPAPCPYDPIQDHKVDGSSAPR